MRPRTPAKSESKEKARPRMFLVPCSCGTTFAVAENYDHLGTNWSRFSWYLRLPAPHGGPWSAIVRCVASAELAPAAAISLANTATAALPRFASEGHKDSRAPQNLYPVGGLERELRRRLGDQALLYRALRVAAGSQILK